MRKPPFLGLRAVPAAALAVALLLGGPACSSPPTDDVPPQTWEQRLALGRLQQAEQLLDEGDLTSARRMAEVALAEARQAAHLPTIARAQALLAALRGDVVQLQDALAKLERQGDEVGLARARLMLAELAVSANRPDIAVGAMEAAAAALPLDVTGHVDSASTRARVYHLQAAVLRLGGRYAEAAAAERRAALALSVLGDDALLPLRVQIAQACGDDLYQAFDARGALVRHAQAADCARRAGDRAAELRALWSLAADFALDGQWRASADHSELALRLALDLRDSAAARGAATCGLAALRALNEPEWSPRWSTFQEAVDG